jgi:hypothetical protein
MRRLLSMIYHESTFKELSIASKNVQNGGGLGGQPYITSNPKLSKCTAFKPEAKVRTWKLITASNDAGKVYHQGWQGCFLQMKAHKASVALSDKKLANGTVRKVYHQTFQGLHHYMAPMSKPQGL